MTSKEIAAVVLNSIVAGAEAVGRSAQMRGDEELRMGAGIAAVLVREVARLLEDRTPDEALAILISIRDHGAQPITKEELDAQVADAVAKLGG
jgi:hypothetical protein